MSTEKLKKCLNDDLNKRVNNKDKTKIKNILKEIYADEFKNQDRGEKNDFRKFKNMDKRVKIISKEIYKCCFCGSDKIDNDIEYRLFNKDDSYEVVYICYRCMLKIRRIKKHECLNFML